MNELIAHIEKSIVDQYFSRAEKKSLKALIQQKSLSADKLLSLKRSIFNIAQNEAHAENFKAIIKWLEDISLTISSSSSAIQQVHFSPGTACREAIIQQLVAANQQVSICVFTISDNVIVDQIINCHRSGLDVKIITDNDKSFDMGSDIAHMQKQGIPVKVDDTRHHMHHKFMVIDQSVVITGSYNWTRSAAEYNHENIVLLQDSKIIKSYQAEFHRLWDAMDAY
jgi:phosphatidylserine/phosphatidylglycerophosphate/cardiolipin synthase-like enzyme